MSRVVLHDEVLSLVERGESERALEALERLLATAGATPERLNDIAALLLSMGRFEEARGRALSALALAPNSAQIMWNLARAHLSLGEVARAVKLFPAMLRAGALTSDILNQAAQGALEAGDLQLAEDLLRFSIRMKGDQPQAASLLNEVRSRRQCTAARSDRTVGYYLGWTGHNNLGDECMFEACREHLGSIEWRAFYNQQAEDLRAELAAPARDGRGIGRMCGMLGGGTFINRHAGALARYLTLCRIVGSALPVFGTGVASPSFWRGRGQWQDLRPRWAEVLRELPIVGVRGPHSKELLEEVGLDNVEVVGDPALLFKTDKDPDRETRGVVAVSIGRSEGNVWGDEDSIEREARRLVGALGERGFRVELMPVWESDMEISRGLLGACNGRVRLHETTTSARMYMDRLAGVDVMVGMKLHSVVLAAAANVPPLCLEYRPKCRDFARSIGWEDHCVRTSELAGADLPDRIGQMIADAAALRRRLAGGVDALERTFRNYCRILAKELSIIAEASEHILEVR